MNISTTKQTKNTPEQLDVKSEVQTALKKMDNAKPSTTKYQPMTYKKCHTGVTEIYPNLFICNKATSLDLVDKTNVDILVPLDSCSADIWSKGWRGFVMFLPIQDYGVLPKEVAEGYADAIIDYMNQGKKVGMFCIGGHGRTGYMTAIILGKLGIEDPIKHVWEKYCEEAIESKKQFDQIVEITGLTALKDIYKDEFKESKWDSWGYYDKWDNKTFSKGAGYDYGYTADADLPLSTFSTAVTPVTSTKKNDCYKCRNYDFGYCTSRSMYVSDRHFTKDNCTMFAQTGDAFNVGRTCLECQDYDPMDSFCCRKTMRVEYNDNACDSFSEFQRRSTKWD